MKLFKKESDISEFREHIIFGKPQEAEAV